GPNTEVPAEATVRIPTEALLMEGARRIDEWARIEKRVPHLGVVAVFAPADESAAGDLDLLPPEWEVLATIDGARDIRAIAQELRRAQRLDPLLPAAYRLCGFALIAVGRFAEAIEQWEQWERLAPRAEEEMAQADVVRQARAAAQVLGGTGTTVGDKGHG